MSERATATVRIVNRLGLHARPAMAFVDLACASKSVVGVSCGGQAVDGKSIMQVMMLAATKGSELEIVATGPDAEETVRRLKELVDGGFGED